MEVAPHLKDSLNRNFFDLLSTFQQISGESVQNQLVVQRVEVPEYLTLYSPAINWILQCIAYRAPEVVTYLHLTYSGFSALSLFLSWIFLSASANRDDGEMQETGKQVSRFALKWCTCCNGFML